MGEQGFGAVIGLQKGEGRAWDLEVWLFGYGADEGSGKNAFAGAEIPSQQNHISGPKTFGECFCKRLSFGFAQA
jgi:hypothetical protein